MDINPELIETAEKRENAATKILEQLDTLAETLREQVMNSVYPKHSFLHNR